MLAPILVILAFILALTGALLETGTRNAQAAWSATVARYADTGLSDGTADLTGALATYVAAHGAAGPFPPRAEESAPKPACGLATAAAACPLRYTVGATFTAASTPGGDGTGDTASNLQGAVIDEQRISVVLTVTLLTPNGERAGIRSRLLTYRVFDAAPYAVIAGSRDVTTINGTQAAAQGDTGGAAAAAGDDTRIHVRLTCRTVIPNIVPFANDQQEAGNDGLPWGNAAAAAYEAPCATPDAPVDAFRDEHWANGDTNTTGWTP